MSRVYQHWIGTAVVQPRDLPASVVETAIDDWFPEQAPEGAKLISRERIDDLTPLFDGIVRLKVTLKVAFLNPKITIVGDLKFQGVIEYWATIDK